MNEAGTVRSWLGGVLTHLSREFSFAHMSATATQRDDGRERPAWYEYFMPMTRRAGCKPKDKEDATKDEEDIPSWDDYFMGMAKLASLRSKDPNTKVGACIVNEDRIIVGMGYNSMPYLNSHVTAKEGMIQNDDVYPWDRKKGWDKETYPDRETKYPYVCSAFLNAFANKNTPSLKNCTVYTTIFPGNKDAQLLIQSGITRVFYLQDKYPQDPFTIASCKLFENAGVKVCAYRKLGKFQEGIPLIAEKE